LRASRDASKHNTARTSPAQSHATSRSKPGRATIPLTERPRFIIIDHLNLAEAAAPSDIDELVLAPLALKIAVDLRLCGLPDIDHCLALSTAAGSISAFGIVMLPSCDAGGLE
jgi:hypothetical protein